MIRFHRRSRRKVRRLVLGLAFAAVAAFAVPLAQAKHLSAPQSVQQRHAAAANLQVSGPTSSGVYADGLRLTAMAKAYQNADAQASRPTPYQLQVEGLRWTAMAKAYKQAGASGAITSTGRATATPSRGFDWRDAGIGAAIAFGVALVLVTGVAVARHHRTGLAST
jgi:hypothetical protein